MLSFIIKTIQYILFHLLIVIVDRISRLPRGQCGPRSGAFSAKTSVGHEPFLSSLQADKSAESSENKIIWLR